MSKTSKLIIAVILLQVTAASARGLITGDRSIEISFATADLKGASVEIRYASLVRPKMELGFSISGIALKYQKYDYTIPVIQGGAAFDFSHILVSARRRTLALWADLHLFLGYESVNMGKNLLDDGAELLNESSLLWGAMAALRFEIPLSQRCAISIRGRCRYTPPSSITSFHTEMGIGIRVRL